ncbi:MAG: hypothetical protein K0R82_2273 [Flavipsychrobacter sp.]|jgi:hypothetical protein|nr:hypothetical protein [Flavipsychrobacter sp.]
METREEIHENPARRLSKAEAYRILQMCHHLEGQVFYEGGAMLGEIECVAVSPHDAINKWLFIHFYADCHDPTEALRFYTVPYYDVILIICTDKGQLTYRNLDAYRPQQQMTG